MTYKQFKDKWIGKGVNFDNHYGAQCVDVYRMYCKEVLDIPQSPSVKGAKNIWTTYLKEHFERISNTPLALPKQGDVIIWDVGTYGHVGICEKATLLTVTCFEENWTELDGSGVSEIRRHNYNNVLGWLSPSGIISEMTAEEKRIINLLKGKTEGDVRQAFGCLTDMPSKDKQIQTLQTKVLDLDSISGDMLKRIETLEGKIKANNELVSSWQKKVLSANKQVEKLSKQYDDMLLEKNKFKGYYEKALDKSADKLSAIELLRLLINKIFKK